MTSSSLRKAKRDEYHHGDLRRVLIESAVQILREEGFDHLSLRLCAKKANVSPSAPAHHFKNLNDLLTAVAVYGFESLADHLQDVCAENDDKKEGYVRAIATAYLEFATKNEALYRVMFMPTLECDDPDFASAHVKCFSLLKKAVTRDSVQGMSVDSEALSFRIWALAHGFIVLLLGDRLHLVFSAGRIPRTRKAMGEAFLKYVLK